MAGEERDVSPALLHVLHRQRVRPVRLRIAGAQTCGALLPLGPAGEPALRDGQRNRPGQQVTHDFQQIPGKRWKTYKLFLFF